tara:strand:- start:1041 stop:1355 length:315 start_codon:yes stop_codon:yes gene_type:complete
VINKKIILGLFLMSFLGACASPTAMLGPAYTFGTTGSTFHTGLTYGSNELITQYTGKTPLENLQDVDFTEEKNIQKQTLQSEDFYILVKNKIEKTSSILNKFNQ